MGDGNFETTEIASDPAYPVIVQAVGIDGDLHPDLLYLDAEDNLHARKNDGAGGSVRRASPPRSGWATATQIAILIC